MTRWSRIALSAAAAAGAALSIQAATTFENETIVFGGDAAYPPFEWLDSGTPRGFDIDLARAVVQLGGAHAEHRLGDWPDAVRALELGEVDALAMFVSEEREQTFLFTPPFYFVDHGIFGRLGSASVTSVEELAGRRVAVEELSYAHQHLQQQALGIELVLTSNTLTALEAVADGHADYAILAAPTASYLIRTRGFPLERRGPPIWPRGYAFAVRKDRPELAEWLTENFYATLRTDLYQSLYERWEDDMSLGERDLLSRTLKLAFVPVAILALAGLVVGWRLRRGMLGLAQRVFEERRDRHVAESRARWVLDHVESTGMPRVPLFIQKVDTLLATANRDSKQIVMIKLAAMDKTIRTRGHGAGEREVSAFAERLRSMKFDAYGQSGRDLFIVFASADRVQEKLCPAASAADTLVLSSEPESRIFAGAATWPEHGATAEDLLRRAEVALAVATEKRERWVEYRRSMEPDESDLRLLETFNATAGAGLYPAFQAQLDLCTGEIVGAEALARWTSPDLGEVTPGRFIPLLEDAGLIRHVTQRMLKESVRVATKLRRDGMACPISVNVSVSDLLTERVRVQLFKALSACDGSPGDIKLELTETSVADQPEALMLVMTRLRDSGIRISIDDFGTGYSSLSYLSDFPVQEIKIDVAFIRRMTRSRKDHSLVRSMIAMAHELGMGVVAEGVETEAQLEMLRRDGCDRVQGFLVSKPLVEPEFDEFMRQSAEGAPALRLSRAR